MEKVSSESGEKYRSGLYFIGRKTILEVLKS
jgi:hypothetical protein